MTDWLSSLAAPAGVNHAAGIITSLDSAFAVGFGRLGPEQVRALEALSKTFSGTPLGKPIEAAAAAIRKSEFIEKHFVALAAARAALQGAQHDALVHTIQQALGRAENNEAPARAESAQEQPSHHGVWLESVRQWLMELAIAGFVQLGPEALLPFSATLEKLQGEDQLIRPAAVLTGFFNELVSSIPIANMPSVPIFRWTDLWTKSMIIAAQPPSPLSEESVSGDFIVLGIDVRQHPNMISPVFYGVLKSSSNNSTRLVRTTLTGYKVDILTGSEMWGVFRGNAKELLTAVKKRSAVKIKGMTLLSSGDLIWDDKRAEAGASADVMGEAHKWFSPAASAEAKSIERLGLAPAERHPAQIAEPIFIENYSSMAKGEGGGWEIKLGSHGLPIAMERMANNADFSIDDVGKSQKLFGLLRYDRGRFCIQPLTVMAANKKDVLMAGSLGASQVAGGDAGGRDSALGILRERAGKLLRKKS